MQKTATLCREEDKQGFLNQLCNVCQTFFVSFVKKTVKLCSDVVSWIRWLALFCISWCTHLNMSPSYLQIKQIQIISSSLNGWPRFLAAADGTHMLWHQLKETDHSKRKTTKPPRSSLEIKEESRGPAFLWPCFHTRKKKKENRPRNE